MNPLRGKNKLGQIFTSSTYQPSLVGRRVWFQDSHPNTSGQGVEEPNYSRHLGCWARLVKNNTGGTLTARHPVKYTVTSQFLEVDDDVDSANEYVDGFVDYKINTTVANGEYFWLIVEGVAEGLGDGSVAAGDFLTPSGTSGRLTTNALNSDALLHAKCARALEADGSAGDAFNIWVLPRA